MPQTSPQTACPSRDQLLDYLLARLPQESLAALELHLDDCPKCEALAEELERVDDSLVEILKRTPDDDTDGNALRTLPSPAAASDGTAFELFGDYELIEKIAEGGMGVVYRARQSALDRIVAVKRIKSGQFASEEEIERFQAEAEAAAQLDHPGIVPVHDVGRRDGQPFYSMAFVEGESLEQRLDDGPIPPKEAAELIAQVADAVHHAHGQGVIHRDLKPANILLGQDGKPRVFDFGLAKRTQVDKGLTVSGQAMGTPSYMPPEQAEGRLGQIGPASDVYALGAIFYAAVTGRPPFRAATIAETLRQVVQNDPVPPRRLNPAVDRDLETITLKCLEKSPAARYRDGEALSADLRRYLHGEPIHARPVGPAERLVRWGRRKPALASAVALAATGLLAAFVACVALVIVKSNAAEELAEENERTQQALGESQQRLAEMEFRKGSEFHDAGRHDLGMLWHARGLEHVQPGTPLDGAIRQCLAGAYRYFHPAPAQVFDAGQVAAISPDGRRVATAQGRAATVWDADSARAVGPPIHEASMIRELLLIGDAILITGTASNGARLWDIPSGKQIARLNHAGPNLLLAASADGRKIVTAAGETIRVWDGRTGESIGKPLSVVAAGQVEIDAVAIGPRGERALVALSRIAGRASRRSWVDRWDLETGERMGKPMPHKVVVRKVAFSRDGKMIATVTAAGRARVGNAETGELIQAMPNQPARLGETPVNYLAFCRDGGLLVGAGNRIKYWDWRSGRIRTLRRTADLGYFRKDADDEHLVLVRRHGPAESIEIDLSSATERPEMFHPAAAPASSAVYSPDGSTILSAAGATARLWNAADGTLLHELQHDAGAVILTARFSPHGRQAVTAGYLGAQVWDVQTGEPVGEPLAAPPAPVNSDNFVRGAAFTARGDKLVVRTNHAMQRWDVPTRKPIGEPIRCDSLSLCMAVSPREETLVTGHADGVARIWDLTSGAQLGQELPHRKAIYFVSLGRGGKHVVTASGDQTAQLWELKSGKRIGRPLEHPEIVAAAALSPDGQTIATADRKSVIRCWDVPTGFPVNVGFPHSVDGPKNGRTILIHLQFSPDGKSILSTGGDRLVRVWPVPNGGVEGIPRQLARWAETATGKRLGDEGAVEALDATEWRKQRETLHRHSGPPTLPEWARVQGFRS